MEREREGEGEVYNKGWGVEEEGGERERERFITKSGEWREREGRGSD